MAERDRSFLRGALTAALTVILAVGCHAFARSTEDLFLNKLATNLRTLLYLGLFTAWGLSIRRRVMQRQVRRFLCAVAWLTVSWLVLRELKFRYLLDPNALRWAWYAYYIPMLLIPLLALLVSMSMERPRSYRLPRRTALLWTPTLLLIALVLSNDLHQTVFRFPAGAEPWSELSYRYGPGYFAAVLWGIGCTLAALSVMLLRAGKPRRWTHLWLPLLPFSAALIYLALYALRSPLIRLIDDLAALDSVVFTAFFECCIQCGLIRTNSRYSQLFRAAAELEAQIVDRDGHVRFAAEGAAPPEAARLREAESGPVILPDGRRLHSQAIPGGRVVWTEDISELLALRETLEARQEELRERNALLQYEYEREREHKTVWEQNRLYDLLQRRTRRQMRRIEALAEEYRAARGPEERRRILAKVVVLGSYIKRRKDFVLSMEASPCIPEAHLKSALDESCRALTLLGIRGGNLVSTGRDDLPGSVLTLAYDFFEDVLEQVLDRAALLSIRICEVRGALRAALDLDCPLDPQDLAERYAGLLVREDDDGGTELVLPLERGAEP